MCFLVDDDEPGGGSRGGSPKLQLKKHRRWVVPPRVVMVILATSIILLFLGLILLAIGGGIGSLVLRVIGGIMLGFALSGLLVCLCVCQLAYFFYGTRDQDVQTEFQWTDEYMTESPGYASIGRPSALKSANSTLNRNGTLGQKKVTMAPEVGPYGESPPNAMQGGSFVVGGRQPDRSPSFSGGFFGEGVKHDPRGAGGRTVGGADVGTGGIRILPAEQPFPSPGSQVSHSTISGSQTYAGSIGSQQAGYGSAQGGYSGGGSSLDTYAYPKSVSIISGNESGYAESGSGSQYSTLRSIPVQHVVTPTQQRPTPQDSVDYARVNKQPKNIQTVNIDVQPQRGYIIHQPGFTQPQPAHIQYQPDDFDYDNPVERTPMLPPKQNQSPNSYHQQQMQYQRQQQQDLYAPRQIHQQSLQRQSAASPYTTHHQQQQQYRTSTSSPQQQSGGYDDIPEPQPLVYPSARRPMTFEQVSSSKISMYDNVLAGLKDDE
ncbi:uncharacterized protein LOC131929738 [Physella acuta]|uniref:uncharacterized protein LOC131929738 n=1 Tax=Physella acuta TaxID=109671 RepID=UPI0027DACFCE|nr:uncharacterized protein LOC131929738 [Physella acuta]